MKSPNRRYPLPYKRKEDPKEEEVEEVAELVFKIGNRGKKSGPDKDEEGGGGGGGMPPPATEDGEEDEDLYGEPGSSGGGGGGGGGGDSQPDAGGFYPFGAASDGGGESGGRSEMKDREEEASGGMAGMEERAHRGGVSLRTPPRWCRHGDGLESGGQGVSSQRGQWSRLTLTLTLTLTLIGGKWSRGMAEGASWRSDEAGHLRQSLATEAASSTGTGRTELLATWGYEGGERRRGEEENLASHALSPSCSLSPGGYVGVSPLREALHEGETSAQVVDGSHGRQRESRTGQRRPGDIIQEVARSSHKKKVKSVYTDPYIRIRIYGSLTLTDLS